MSELNLNGDFFDEVLSKTFPDSDKTIAEEYPESEYDYFIFGCTAMKNHQIICTREDEFNRLVQIDNYDNSITYKDKKQFFINKSTCYLHTNANLGMLSLAEIYICLKDKDEIRLKEKNKRKILSEFSENDLLKEIILRRHEKKVNQ